MTLRVCDTDILDPVFCPGERKHKWGFRDLSREGAFVSSLLRTLFLISCCPSMARFSALYNGKIRQLLKTLHEDTIIPNGNVQGLLGKALEAIHSLAHGMYKITFPFQWLFCCVTFYLICGQDNKLQLSAETTVCS